MAPWDACCTACHLPHPVLPASATPPAEPAATPASNFPPDYLERVKQTHQVPNCALPGAALLWAALPCAAPPSLPVCPPASPPVRVGRCIHPMLSCSAVLHWGQSHLAYLLRCACLCLVPLLSLTHALNLPCPCPLSIPARALARQYGGYGSVGYGYDWKIAEAEKNLLRTHTTAVSSRMLYRLAQVGGKGGASSKGKSEQSRAGLGTPWLYRLVGCACQRCVIDFVACEPRCFPSQAATYSCRRTSSLPSTSPSPHPGLLPSSTIPSFSPFPSPQEGFRPAKSPH